MTFDLELPVSVAVPGASDDHASGNTEQISGDDVVFVSPVRFRAGERIRLAIRMGRHTAAADCCAHVKDSQAVFGADSPLYRTMARFVRSPKILKPEPCLIQGAW